jgi:cytochrome c-type biogenesis protein CcmH
MSVRRRFVARALAVAIGASFAFGALAQTGPAPSGLPPEQERELLHTDRFRQLASELRCLVCQNQTLADSNAELAVDLRNEVLRQMAAGRDDAQIKTRLVERYGEFVLYRPAYSARNLLLWIGPALLLAIGAAVVWRMSRPRAAAPMPPVADEAEAARARIDRLLGPEDAPRG